jgi:hypothetical protein
MKTTSSLAAIASVVALALAFTQPAFAQRVIGNIYPDSTDSPESSAGRDPGDSSAFGSYSLSEPDLPPAPRGSMDYQPDPMAGSLTKGFAPESSNGPWMQRPEGAFAQPWVNPSTPATVPMRESSPAYSPRAGTYRPFN